MKTALLIVIGLVLMGCSTTPHYRAGQKIKYSFETIDGVKVSYREIGNPSKPTVLLLHGFPTSSHMFRNLMKDLGNDFHLIAPDYPGFGESDSPGFKKYNYTFDNLSKTIDVFIKQKGIKKFYIYMQDYGAPVGFRLALMDPFRVLGLIIQNGNAYTEGLGEIVKNGPVAQYWKSKSSKLEKMIVEKTLNLQALKWQYTYGTRKPENVSPDNWNLDFMKISRKGNHKIQLSLLYDYQNNLKQYPAWQKYLRKYQPPTLIVWGKNDPFFPEPGAEAYKKDLKNIDYNILDTGHFALEEDGGFIAYKIKSFVRKQ